MTPRELLVKTAEVMEGDRAGCTDCAYTAMHVVVPTSRETAPIHKEAVRILATHVGGPDNKGDATVWEWYDSTCPEGILETLPDGRMNPAWLAWNRQRQIEAAAVMRAAAQECA